MEYEYLMGYDVHHYLVLALGLVILDTQWRLQVLFYGERRFLFHTNPYETDDFQAEVRNCPDWSLLSQLLSILYTRLVLLAL